MFEVQETPEFKAWRASLSDGHARSRIAARVARVALGLVGDAKSVGGSVSELRIDHGPGYRLYFTRRGRTLLILLCGGDKGSQDRDIRRAQTMASSIGEFHAH